MAAAEVAPTAITTFIAAALFFDILAGLSAPPRMSNRSNGKGTTISISLVGTGLVQILIEETVVCGDHCQGAIAVQQRWWTFWPLIIAKVNLIVTFAETGGRRMVLVG
jgi:hypothetical protein